MNDLTENHISAAGRRNPEAFTLVEVLFSMAILAVLLVIMSQGVSGISSIWRRSTGKLEQFRESRAATESLSRTLSQATLNPYFDYQRATATSPPTNYIRQSELRFISGPASTSLGLTNRVSHALFFQAPLGLTSRTNTTATTGLQSLLNTCGYYIEFGDDSALRPSFLSNNPALPLRYRFRLYEMREPADGLTIYRHTSGTDSSGGVKNLTYTGKEWYRTPLSTANAPVQLLAENIVAMIILPELSKADQTATPSYTSGSLAPNYAYDSSTNGVGGPLGSKNQLPPVLNVTLVAVDEASYGRFQGRSTTMPTTLGLDTGTLFTTVGDTLNTINPGFARDLATLENNLKNNNISYHVFTMKISPPGSKWSTQ